ncbi:unnamed protein product [Brassicogethes aeneus]|uniref:Deacetylase sirtuin-type domain-containing protein n=1 Tax=Brassicogethes aeneus TaxID=1431903 RepID=A0A9P0ASZ3_BRAAE|nr:unnamed protein product [Brassicogethes aeneus]
MSKVILYNFNHLRKNFSTISCYVPKHNPVQDNDIEILQEFIQKSMKMVILTGAGISTESGIPDYRSEEVGMYARTDRRPVQYQDFLKSSETRKRYWARNFIGFDNFSKVKPNSVHYSIRNLEVEHDKVTKLVTQNVDSLHFKAGSKQVVELHGTAFKVVCLSCEAEYDRFYIQERLKEVNSHLFGTSEGVRPDGDVEISQDTQDMFVPPSCESCGGILKPDIVFFGDNVPKIRVEEVRNSVTKSDSLLILGSSLSVFSGYRIVLQAVEEGKNVAIVNIGPTRADKDVKLKINAKCGDILPKIC